MYLRPSEIRFSQDSIGRSFGGYTSHPGRPIGETLDDILRGEINVSSIPRISVLKKDGQWCSADYRRLWVFQEAEKRGKCTEIYVQETSFINYNKFTTINNGISVYVRGDPGGYLWRRMPVTNSHPKHAPKFLSFPSSKLPITANNFPYLKNQMEDNPEMWSTKHDRNVQPNKSFIMSKPLDDFISADFSIHSTSHGATQQDQHYSNSRKESNDTKNGLTTSAKLWDESNIKTGKHVLNVSSVQNIETNGSFHSANSEKLTPIEQRTIAVTMADENVQSQKRNKTKRYVLLFTLCFILVTVVLLSLILSITLTHVA